MRRSTSATVALVTQHGDIVDDSKGGAGAYIIVRLGEHLALIRGLLRQPDVARGA